MLTVGGTASTVDVMPRLHACPYIQYISCGSVTLWGWHTTAWIVSMCLVPLMMLLIDASTS